MSHVPAWIQRQIPFLHGWKCQEWRGGRGAWGIGANAYIMRLLSLACFGAYILRVLSPFLFWCRYAVKSIPKRLIGGEALEPHFVARVQHEVRLREGGGAGEEAYDDDVCA